MVQHPRSFGDARVGIVAGLEPNSRTNLESRLGILAQLRQFERGSIFFGVTLPGNLLIARVWSEEVMM
jgi:hypothetical protein